MLICSLSSAVPFSWLLLAQIIFLSICRLYYGLFYTYGVPTIGTSTGGSTIPLDEEDGVAKVGFMYGCKTWYIVKCTS
jgi:hypothetical protein